MGKASFTSRRSLASDYDEYRKKEWSVGSYQSDSDCGSLSSLSRQEPSDSSISISSMASKISRLGSYISRAFSSCFDSSDNASDDYDGPVTRSRAKKKKEKKSQRPLRTPTMQQVKDDVYDYFSKRYLARNARLKAAKAYCMLGIGLNWPSSDGTPGISSIGSASTGLETPPLAMESRRRPRNRLQKRHMAPSQVPLEPPTEERPRRGIRNLLQKRHHAPVESPVGIPTIVENNGDGILDFMQEREAEIEKELERRVTADLYELKRRDYQRDAMRRKAEEPVKKFGRRIWGLPERKTVTRPPIRRENWVSEDSTYQVASDVARYDSKPQPNRLQRLASPWESTSFSVFPKRQSEERNGLWKR